MANVYDVADFFIELANQSEEDTITNLKLNKLLYFAQGHHLAKTGTPLFSDPIEARKFGPVVQAIYQKYKICGKNHILSDGKDVSEAFTDKEYDILLDVAREYCKYTAAHLVNLTHAPETPWSNTKKENQIDTNSIEAYFLNKEKVLSFEEILAKKDIKPIGYRDEDGYLVLPKEEDDEYWDKYDEM